MPFIFSQTKHYFPVPEMRQRVWNPAVESTENEIGGGEEGEGHGEKSLSSAASVVGPFLLAQLRNQFNLLRYPRPLPFLPSFPFPFPPPLPPFAAADLQPVAIPPPFMMVAAMLAAAPQAFHVGTFGTASKLIPPTFDGPNRSLLPPLAIGIQAEKQCQKGDGAFATENGQNGNEMNEDKRTKKRKREKVPKKERNGEKREEKQREEEEEEEQKAKKGKNNNNNNPIVQLVMNGIEGHSKTVVNFNTCAICGLQFNNTSDLVQHARTNHLERSRYDRNVPRVSIAEEAQREREWGGQRKRDSQTQQGETNRK